MDYDTTLSTRTAELKKELEDHPLQYAIRLPGAFSVHGITQYNTENTPAPKGETWERYNRCPNCDQWSPCDRRKAILAEIQELEKCHTLSRCGG